MKFDEYYRYCLDAAQIHDQKTTKQINPRLSRRKANVHIFDDGTFEEYDDYDEDYNPYSVNNHQLSFSEQEAEDFGLSISYGENKNSNPKNPGKFPNNPNVRKVFMNKETWQKLSTEDKEQWDKITQEGKSYILGYAKDRTLSRANNAVTKAKQQRFKANEHDLLTFDDDEDESGTADLLALQVSNAKTALSTSMNNSGTLLPPKPKTTSNGIDIRSHLSQPSRNTYQTNHHEFIDRSDETPYYYEVNMASMTDDHEEQDDTEERTDDEERNQSTGSVHTFHNSSTSSNDVHYFDPYASAVSSISMSQVYESADRYTNIYGNANPNELTEQPQVRAAPYGYMRPPFQAVPRPPPVGETMRRDAEEGLQRSIERNARIVEEQERMRQQNRNRTTIQNRLDLAMQRAQHQAVVGRHSTHGRDVRPEEQLEAIQAENPQGSNFSARSPPNVPPPIRYTDDIVFYDVRPNAHFDPYAAFIPDPTGIGGHNHDDIPPLAMRHTIDSDSEEEDDSSVPGLVQAADVDDSTVEATTENTPAEEAPTSRPSYRDIAQGPTTADNVAQTSSTTSAVQFESRAAVQVFYGDTTKLTGTRYLQDTKDVKERSDDDINDDVGLEDVSLGVSPPQITSESEALATFASLTIDTSSSGETDEASKFANTPSLDMAFAINAEEEWTEHSNKKKKKAAKKMQKKIQSFCQFLSPQAYVQTQSSSDTSSSDEQKKPTAKESDSNEPPVLKDDLKSEERSSNRFSALMEEEQPDFREGGSP
jgi:hypothetical protein